MWAQVLVVAIGAITPVIAAGVVAPRLFHMHLMQAGVKGNEVLVHAEAAFNSALAIAVTLGVIMSLLAAGAVSWFLVRRISSPIESLAESAQAVASGDYDIATDTHAFSRELQQLTDSFTSMAQQLERSDATRTSMLADLAHEVRTPLATLQAYIDGLEDGVLECDAAAWATMRAQVERLRRLADDIREVAAAEEHALGLKLQPLDINATANSAVEAALPRYRTKGVDLEVSAESEPCRILGDEMRLQQVLANLLDNALRHTPCGGSVRVSVTRGSDIVRITVTDTGEGIPRSQLDSVFRRFHRVDPSRGSGDGSGSGLGLTIARAIVVDHGGAIDASSDGPGSGATFTVRLPLAGSLVP